MSVKDIYSQISQGYAKSNRYEVTIYLPSGVVNKVPKTGISDYLGGLESTFGIPNQVVDNFTSMVNIPSLQEFAQIGLNKALSAGGMGTERITFNCESTQMPGVALGQNERRTYGAIERVPYAQLYQEIPMTFYCSLDHVERKFFELWHSFIYNRETNDYNFADEYTTFIEIKQLDENDNVTYNVKLNRAFPLSLSPIDYSYQNSNGIARFTVSMSFKDYSPILIDPVEKLRETLS